MGNIKVLELLAQYPRLNSLYIESKKRVEVSEVLYNSDSKLKKEIEKFMADVKGKYFEGAYWKASMKLSATRSHDLVVLELITV